MGGRGLVSQTWVRSQENNQGGFLQKRLGCLWQSRESPHGGQSGVTGWGRNRLCENRGGSPREVLSLKGEGEENLKLFKLLNNPSSRLYSAIYRSSSEQQQQRGHEGGGGKRGFVFCAFWRAGKGTGDLCSKKPCKGRNGLPASKTGRG